jgi:hypothetical protein
MSVTKKVKVRFNWNASTTIQNGRHYFRNVLTKGPLSRLNFCTIPEREIGADMPVYGSYDSHFDEMLRPYIEHLNQARGLVNCPQATRLARKLCARCADFSRLSRDRVYENFSFRALVIAWLKACVLYVANGCKWERAFDDFIGWSLDYDLWCKMRFFGEAVERANSMGARIGTRGPRNLLELLPTEFTLEDAKTMRTGQGKSNADRLCEKMISQWLFRGYILQITDYSFKKNISI